MDKSYHERATIARKWRRRGTLFDQAIMAMQPFDRQRPLSRQAATSPREERKLTSIHILNCRQWRHISFVCSLTTGASATIFSYATPSAKLELLLHAACRRALGLGRSFIDQIHAYRSVLALAREVRMRCAGALFDGDNHALFARLAEVCERACLLGLEPELPFADAILVQRLVVRLSRAARQAGDAGAAAHPISKQYPVHREKPVQHDAVGGAERADEGDYRLSAWRNDHTTERDRRAHEKLRTVIDERVISKVKARNRRNREAREAAARAAVG